MEEYSPTLKCAKCGKRYAETDLTWVWVNGAMKLLCDICRKVKAYP
jgi:hypothetical protein